jgi:hypothetical protein
MSEESASAQAPEAQEAQEPQMAAPSLPLQSGPIPPFYLFPRPLLEDWLAIPPSEYVEARLTRNDVDQLLLGLMKAFDAQEAIDRALVGWSNGNLAEANAALEHARRLRAMGQNEVRQFFASLMLSATRKPKHGSA